MLTLIQRDNCALCDEAWEILYQAGVSDFESVYIDGDKELEQRFGHLVPVLSLEQFELPWPFTVEQVQLWLRALQ
jgi:hypothetical protein